MRNAVLRKLPDGGHRKVECNATVADERKVVAAEQQRPDGEQHGRAISTKLEAQFIGCSAE